MSGWLQMLMSTPPMSHGINQQISDIGSGSSGLGQHHGRPQSVSAMLYNARLHVIFSAVTAILYVQMINEQVCPPVIWEEGRVAALSHTYAVKSPLVTMVRPEFASKSTPSRGPISKPHYLPHPWTHPTYDAKRHPDLIGRFSTMHWTDGQIVHGKV